MSFNNSPKPVVAIAFAAGRGTRLQPITDTIPKPMIKIGGKTLLERNLEKYLPFVSEYVIVVNWLKEVIMDFFGDNYKQKPVQYAVQEKYNGGTLDALLVALDKYPNLEDYNFLAFNTDDILGDGFYQSVSQNIGENPNQALICSKYIGDRDLLKSFGVLESDDDGNLVKIHEKSENFVSNDVSIGLYYFPGSVLKQYLPEFLGSYVQTTKEKYLTDLIDFLAIKAGIKVISLDDQWQFFSTPKDLENL